MDHWLFNKKDPTKEDIWLFLQAIGLGQKPQGLKAALQAESMIRLMDAKSVPHRVDIIISAYKLIDEIEQRDKKRS